MSDANNNKRNIFLFQTTHEFFPVQQLIPEDRKVLDSSNAVNHPLLKRITTSFVKQVVHT